MDFLTYLDSVFVVLVFAQRPGSKEKTGLSEKGMMLLGFQIMAGQPRETDFKSVR